MPGLLIDGNKNCLPLKSTLSFSKSPSTADAICLGSISLNKGKWSLFSIGLSNSTSVEVILRREAQVCDLHRTDDKNDPERRPTDLTANARVRMDMFAVNRARKIKEDGFFM